MIDYAILSFSFLQGLLAFFAPCAVSLLPGYLSAFITRSNGEAKTSSFALARRALFFSVITMAGLVTVYGIATVLVLVAREFIKSAIVYLALGLGVVVIGIGIMMLMNKPLSFSFHGPRVTSKSHVTEAYVFGISYAIGILGCLFPFFLTVSSFAIGAPTVLVGAAYLGVYIAGMALLMVAFYVLALFARKFLQTVLTKFLPHINRVGGVLVIAAGIYIIWYQSALL